jgi:hypothetical protein
MAEALLNPEPSVGGRGKKNRSETGQFSKTLLNSARLVLRYSRPLAEEVLRGITPLDQALTKVQQEQQFQQSDEAHAGLRLASGEGGGAAARRCGSAGRVARSDDWSQTCP